jgi:tight adherence protein C
MRRMSGRRKIDPATLPSKKQTSSAAKLMERVAPFAVRPVLPKSDQEMSMLRMKLANAGFRKEAAPVIFLASKTVLGIGLGGLILAFTIGGGQPLKSIVGLSVFGAGIGFVLPNLWLALGRKQRAQAIRNGLPDALDLMVVSVEAGLGLDAAIQRVADEFTPVHPELSEELKLASHETTMGVPRGEALNGLAIRTGVPEVKSLVAVVTQAEKFGTSIAKALRNQSDALRTKRRQAAEERAQKTAVKLMAPLILFIFPAIFVVLVGPAVLRMIRTFSTNAAFQ